MARAVLGRSTPKFARMFAIKKTAASAKRSTRHQVVSAPNPRFGVEQTLALLFRIK
jgi:hypothetical protein